MDVAFIWLLSRAAKDPLGRSGLGVSPSLLVSDY